MRRLSMLVALLCPLFVVARALAAPSGDCPGVERVRAAELLSTVRWLASPQLEGRLGGSPGYMTAARTLAARFHALGLEPGPRGTGGVCSPGSAGHLQPLTVEYAEIPRCDLALVGPDGVERPLRLGPDHVCRCLTGSGDATAPVVFAGYGLSCPEKGYDDYAGVDARGAIVLAFKEAPPFRVDTLGWGDAPLPRPKGLTAAQHGAVALLLVSRPLQEHPQAPIGSILEGPGRQDERFPRLQVSEAVAQSLLDRAGLDLRALEARIDSNRAPASAALGARAHVRVKARYDAQRPTANVVGILRGGDPALRDQYLVVGAHLDHVGRQGDLYFPGANDNASGAAAVVALAEAFARAGARPKRSVVFALFSSEESGLDGARRFVADPPVPLDRIVAMFNLDCVGHGDSIQVGSGRTSPRLWAMARELDAADARLTVEETWGGGGADASPFADKGIPTLYFASRFSYTWLHLPGDRPETLNPRMYEALARLAYRTAWAVADGDYAGEETEAAARRP